MTNSTLAKISASSWFNNLVLFTILLSAIVVGIQTYGERVAAWSHTLEILDMVILLVFTAELVIKIVAEGNQPLNYFKDPWNVFDFLVVAICWLAHFIPGMNAGFVSVIRLARVLRVLRLVNALPQLKMLVDAMLKSIPSMGYVGIFLGILFYIYGAMGVFLFGKNDPLHFHDLPTSCMSLFQIVTLEGWAEIMNVNVFGCNDANYGYPDKEMCTNPSGMGIWAVIYFISFVLIGTMIVLNLFIGVIMNSMDEVRAEQAIEDRTQRKKLGLNKVEDELAEMHYTIDSMKEQLNFIAHRLKKEGKNEL